MFRWSFFILMTSLAVSLAAGQEERNPLHVLLVYDLEGVTDVTTARHPAAHCEVEYAVARRSLTDDVNAAIAGLVAAGATEILVVDGHGSGNSREPDVLEQELRPPARMLYRDKPYDPYFESMDSSLDAVVAIGMHAGAGNEAGFLRHTLTMEAVEYKINGIAVNESMLLAASAARYKIPLVMVSGDEFLQQELARQLPWVEMAVVKRAVSRSASEPVNRAEASRRIEAAARNGLENRATAGQPAWTPPWRFAIRFQDELQASLAAIFPGAVLRDDGVTVEVPARDFEDGYFICRRMLKAASVATMAVLRGDVLEAQPNAEALRSDLYDRMVGRWLASPPAATEGKDPVAARPRFWGVK